MHDSLRLGANRAVATMFVMLRTSPGMILAGFWDRIATTAHTGDEARWQDLLSWEERW